VPAGGAADLRPLRRRDGDCLQHRPLPSARDAAAQPRAVCGARSARPPDRQQAGRDPAPRQRARRRAPSESAQNPAAARRPGLDPRGRRRGGPDDGAARGDGARRHVHRNFRAGADHPADRSAPVSGEPASRYLNRELSWLAFNDRVLEEAQDPATPLLERLKFAAIAASNLDEFFMVRVAGLQHAVADGDESPDIAGLTSSQQLAAVTARTHEMVAALYRLTIDELLPALANAGVRIVAWKELGRAQQVALSTFFLEELLPVLTPLAIDLPRPFPLLSSLSLNLALRLDAAPGETTHRLAIVQVPPALTRLVQLAEAGGVSFVLLEEIISAHLPSLFPGQPILDSAVIRLARDAELEFDDEGGRTQLELVERELRHRRRSDVVRLEVGTDASDELVALLREQLDISEDDVYAVPGPLDLR